MFCPNCGANIPDGSAFCTSCGNRMASSYQSQYQQPQYQQPQYQQAPPQYQQAAYGQQPPMGGYRAPINKRNLVTCIILTIVTCGIYGIIWMIGMVDDLNTASQSQGESSGVTVFLLSLVTCGIYSWVWLYKAGEKVNTIKRLNGEVPDSNASIIYLVLGLLGLGVISYYLIQDQLNKVAAY